MEIAINDVGQLRKSLKVVVTTKEIKEKYQEKFDYIQKNIRVKGFRPGHIPTTVIERKYGEAIEHEIKTELLQSVLSSIEDKNNLKIMGEPQFKEEKNFNRDSDWNFEFIIDLQPQFEIPSYKGMELKKIEVNVTDEELSKRLDMIRHNKGTLSVVENEPSKEEDSIIGDVVVMLGETKLWEKANTNLAVKDTEVFGLPITKNDLLGRKAGETIELSIVIPQEFQTVEHRGKTAKFTCKISEVKRMKLQDLDDAFAKEFACEGLEDLKNKLREQMKLEKQMQMEMQQEEELFEKMLKEMNVAYPEEFIKERVAQAKQDFIRRQKGQHEHKHEHGHDEHEHAEHEHKHENCECGQDHSKPVKTDDEIETEWKTEEPKANQEWHDRIREYFLINRIADLENVEVTEADINQHFQQIAWQIQRWPNEIRSQYEKMGMMDEVRFDIKKRKIMFILRENAKFID